jgi:hypothetical protein
MSSEPVVAPLSVAPGVDAGLGSDFAAAVCAARPGANEDASALSPERSTRAPVRVRYGPDPRDVLPRRRPLRRRPLRRHSGRRGWAQSQAAKEGAAELPNGHSQALPIPTCRLAVIRQRDSGVPGPQPRHRGLHLTPASCPAPVRPIRPSPGHRSRAGRQDTAQQVFTSFTARSVPLSGSPAGCGNVAERDLPGCGILRPVLRGHDHWGQEGGADRAVFLPDHVVVRPMSRDQAGHRTSPFSRGGLQFGVEGASPAGGSFLLGISASRPLAKFVGGR